MSAVENPAREVSRQKVHQLLKNLLRGESWIGRAAVVAAQPIFKREQHIEIPKETST